MERGSFMNRIKSLCHLILIVGTLFLTMMAEGANVPALSEPHRKFLDEAHWIISDYEKNAFLSLKSDQDRDRFIQAFWEDRDPTPGTKKNEFKEEHSRRFEYATKHYGREAPFPGWKTDRGRVYILLGKPEFVRAYSNSFEIYPLELWHYVGYKGYGLPSSLLFLFYQKNGTGPHRLYSPIHDGLSSLFNPHRHGELKTDQQLFNEIGELLDPEVAHATLSSIPTAGGDPNDMFGSLDVEMIQGKVQNARNYGVEKRKYVEDIIRDRPAVQVYYSIGTEGIRNGLYWFQAPNGNFYLDYAVEYAPDKLDMGVYETDYYTSLTVDGQITTPEKVQIDQIIGSHEIKLKKDEFEKVKTVPFQYQGRKPMVPGKYLVTLILSNNVSRNSVTLTDNVEIPDMSSYAGPYITRLLPIRSVENASVDDKKFRPFQFGDKSFIPNLPAKYSQSGGMQIYHQLIFPETFRIDAGPLVLHYLIRAAKKVESETTQPLDYSSSSLAGNVLDIRKDLSLANLPLGSKELVVELRQNGKVLSSSAPLLFSVEPEVNQGVWKFLVGLPDLDSPYHSLSLAQQLVRLKRTKEAFTLLEEAIQEHPDSIDVQLQLMRVALATKNYARVLELGKPMEVKNPRNIDLIWMMGWASYGLENYEDAVRFFERYRLEDPKKIEVLNLLADSYYRLDQRAKSLERVQQSLAIKPQQQDILELKRKLESNE